MRPSVIVAACALAAAGTQPLPAQPSKVEQAKPMTATQQTAAQTSAAKPPVAERRPHSFTLHGVTITDDYAWLKDASYPKVDDPDVLAYLKAENAYFDAQMADRQPQIEALFQEMRARLKEDDFSVPYRDGEWEYWWRFDKGAQYRSWYRRRAGTTGEELLISEPKLAEGKSYFRMGAMAVSPDGKLLAYSADDDGSERFKLKIRDLVSGEDTVVVAANSLGQPVWSADSQSLLWTEVNDQWRPFRVRVHAVATAPGNDPIVYEERDPSFFVGLSRSQDRRWFVISAADHVTSEVRLLRTDRPTGAPTLVSPRQAGREYEVDVSGDTLYVRANDTHKNFRIATASVAKPGEWRDLIPGSDRHYLRGVSAFTNALVVTERVDGLDQVRLRSPDGSERYVPFPEASYSAGLGPNAEPTLTKLRLSYSSMVTPSTVFDFDPATSRLETLKVQEVPSGYDPSKYATERLMATARDGTKVPVSIVYRRDFKRDGTGRLHLYGYGAYGLAIPPSFSTSRLSLLDRGFAFAIAHIRGGDDLGYQWYLDGKLAKRANTFNDFVDVATFLAAQGFAREGNISASGGSAGGTLMGAVLNSNPGLWRAVVAHVPFVDVLNTMLDDSLPLTPIEWPEWGNPRTDKAAFDLIRSYSPYDNVRRQAYPPILITAGLNDPRVTYWEPAKWAARLRATKTDGNLLLLKTNMGAGHGGKSGRFDSLRETAEEYAFILKAFGD